MDGTPKPAPGLGQTQAGQRGPVQIRNQGCLLSGAARGRDKGEPGGDREDIQHNLPERRFRNGKGSPEGEDRARGGRDRVDGNSHPSGVREGSRRQASSWPQTIRTRFPDQSGPLTRQAREPAGAGFLTSQRARGGASETDGCWGYGSSRVIYSSWIGRWQSYH